MGRRVLLAGLIVLRDKFPVLDYDIGTVERLSSERSPQDFFSSSRIASLGIQRCTGNMRSHSMIRPSFHTRYEFHAIGFHNKAAPTLKKV